MTNANNIRTPRRDRIAARTNRILVRPADRRLLASPRPVSIADIAEQFDPRVFREIVEQEEAS